MSKEAAKKPRAAIRKIPGKKGYVKGKVLPRGTLTIEEPKSAQEDAPIVGEAAYDQYLLDEMDKIAIQIDATSDEVEKKKLKELHMAKRMQLSDQAKPVSVAIPEITPEDQKLLKEIEDLHVQMQASTDKSSKASLRAQIMEKRKLMSCKAQPSLEAVCSRVIKPSDDKDKVLLEKIQVLSNFMMTTAPGPARNALQEEMRAKQ